VVPVVRPVIRADVAVDPVFRVLEVAKVEEVEY
jgi:hypothetical protein